MRPDPTKDSTGAAAGADLPRYTAPVVGGNTIYLTREEIALMVVLLSLRQPEDFKSAAAKALVLKCQANTESVGYRTRQMTFDAIRIVDTRSKF